VPGHADTPVDPVFHEGPHDLRPMSALGTTIPRKGYR
jgi:hypothetical protein